MPLLDALAALLLIEPIELLALDAELEAFETEDLDEDEAFEDEDLELELELELELSVEAVELGISVGVGVEESVGVGVDMSVMEGAESSTVVMTTWWVLACSGGQYEMKNQRRQEREGRLRSPPYCLVPWPWLRRAQRQGR